MLGVFSVAINTFKSKWKCWQIIILCIYYNICIYYLSSRKSNQLRTLQTCFWLDCLMKSMHGMIKRYILVNDWGVSRPVLIDYRHHESDEFWPEVQVLYRRTLLVSGKFLLPTLQGRKLGWWESENSLLRVKQQIWW